MLQQFLKIVQGSEVQSHFDIARKMKISPAMVVEIARDLTQRGYLNEYNADCLTEKPFCQGCMVSSACHQMGRTWMLTEKGKKVVSE